MPSDEAAPASSPLPPESRYFCRARIRPVGGNAAELLSDGTEVFGRMLGALDGACSSVSIEMYRFASDGVGNRFARTLAEAVRRGVRARVLVDAAGCRDTPRTFFGWMRSRGIEVRGVNPLRHFLRHGLARGWRDHRKMVLVDQEAAFVGGLNLCREGTDLREGGGGWRDAAVLLRGPLVAELSDSFERSWGEEGRARPGPAPSASVPEPAGEVPAFVLESPPAGGGARFGSALRYAVRRARRKVWIASPYFLPPLSLRRELRRAARRGVDVRVLVPSRSDCPLVLWASQRSYASLLRAGIRLFEWTASMMHAKVAVVDGLWSTTGSHNLDPLSLFRNRELSVALLGRAAGLPFERMLESDFSRSRELELRAWRLRGALRRLAERACAGFRGLF